MRISIRMLAGAFLCLAFVCAGDVFAQAPPKQPKDMNERLHINFAGNFLDRVVKLVSDELDIRFLYDDKINKRPVNFFSPVDIKRGDLFAVLLSILEMQNFTMVKAGPPDAEIWKIVPVQTPTLNPAMKGILKPVKVEDIDKLEVNEELATLVVTLQYVDARSAFIAVQGMVSDPRMVQAIESANVVIVTDTSQNLHRIAEIVKLMDQPKPGALIEVIQLKNADPADLVNKLQPLLQSWASQDQGAKMPGQPPDLGFGATNRPVLIADERTQQVIVFATKDRIAQLKGLIEKLDIPVKYAERTVHVIFLRNATAQASSTDTHGLAAELNDIYKGGLYTKEPGATPGGPGGTPAGPGQQPRSTVPSPPGPSPGTTGTSTAGYGTSIVADIPNNAIIIVASETIFRELAKIVSDLDIRRPSVEIHGYIAEVSANHNIGTGVEVATTDNPTKHNYTQFASTSFGLTRIVDLDNDGIPEGRVPAGSPAGSAISGLAWGLMKRKFQDIPIFLNLSLTKEDIKILAEPNLVVNDNVRAMFTVSDQVPTTQTNVTGTGIQVTTFAGFQNASLTLEITPHIGAENYLRLELHQLIEKFRGQGQVINGTQLPPAKASREVFTTVTVPNQRTVVISGLTDNTDDTTTNGIPYISDIPLIGKLFQRTTSIEDRKTIYIFITPTILADRDFVDYLKKTKEYQNRAWDMMGQFIGVKEPEDDKQGSLDTVTFRSPFPHPERSVEPDDRPSSAGEPASPGRERSGMRSPYNH